jgi:cyclopropane fatty-acyl-phospholipid synthase-like methyltransferase
MPSAPKHKSRPYIFEFLLWTVENVKTAALLPVPLAFTVMYYYNKSIYWLPIYYLLCIGLPIVFYCIYMLVSSSTHDGGAADWEKYIEIHDAEMRVKFKGKKIPMETMVEAYINGKLDFLNENNLIDVLLRKNQLFRFCLTLGHLKFFFKNFLNHITGHSTEDDHKEVGDVYNRGNKFYNLFLGETMIYTSGMWQNPEDTLEIAQKRKLDTVAKYIQLKEGDEHLDIGCGWGTLIRHYAKNYRSNSTGCTLAEEQVKWGMELAKKEKIDDKINFLCCDYRKIPEKTGNKKYDKITCLEMAEHVGVKNFSSFLCQVNDMLKDDGIFYLQIAGLRRPWHWEDLIWGLFMAKYIFPGADASCPLNWVVNQLERNGFEVHRVENMGVHYARTIEEWYKNWVSNKKEVIATHNTWWYRIWSMFLAWSTIIARQGSSTVFMITCNKNTRSDISSVSKEEGKGMFNRVERWIGPDVVASQQ